MVWYIAIFVSIALTIFAYRKRRSIHRLGDDEVGDLVRILGTDFGVTATACVTLLLVLLYILFSNPSTAEYKNTRRDQELVLYEQVGFEIGKNLLSAAKGGEALVIDRETGEEGDAYYAALKKGLERGFDGRIKITAEETVSPDESSNIPQDFLQTEKMWIRNDVIDRLCGRHSKCNVIVSFVGVEDKFRNSRLAQAAVKKQRHFGLFTGNVYTMGSALLHGQITTAVIPNPSYELDPNKTTFTFDERYLVINKSNLQSIVSRYGRLIYVLKRPAKGPKQN